jgi:hypothetical protein
VNAGDCGCQTPTGINVKDAQRFQTDFVDAQNGNACTHFDGPFCLSPVQSGTITPTCSGGTCVAVVCDLSNSCTSN